MMLVQAFSLRNSFLLDPCDSSYRKELEAGKPAWMQKCHWTVGPKCSCGLDSALTYKGIMDMRLDVAVPVETFITALKEDVTVGLSVQQHRRALLVLPSAFPFLSGS